MQGLGLITPFYKVVLVGVVVIATNELSELWRGRILCCQNFIGSQGSFRQQVVTVEKRGGKGKGILRGRVVP